MLTDDTLPFPMAFDNLCWHVHPPATPDEDIRMGRISFVNLPQCPVKTLSFNFYIRPIQSRRGGGLVLMLFFFIHLCP